MNTSSDILCDIIVLTWNQRSIIEDYLKSFFENIDLRCRLIIVDNGSTDGTKEFLETIKGNDLVDVEVIINEKNLGAPKGKNQGLEISTAPYVCVTDNDVIFTKGWLREMIATFETNEKIGLINPMSNTVGIHPEKGECYDDVAKRLQKEYHAKFVEMPFGITFCMGIRREVLEKAGNFDEVYTPFWLEDTDYSLKAQRAGFLVGAAKGMYIYHNEHSSPVHVSKEKEAIFKRSDAIYRKKWGKIMRVAIASDDGAINKEIIEHAVELSRNGNYVFLFSKDYDGNKEKLFANFDMIENTGVNVIKYKNSFELFYKITKKKKKYDVFIGSILFSSLINFLRGTVCFKEFNMQSFMKLKMENK